MRTKIAVSTTIQNLDEGGNLITLERAVFLSWWCDKGDCAFCYMSTQKDKIKDPTKARRNIYT